MSLPEEVRIGEARHMSSWGNPLPEEVRIGEARHVSSWGNPDGDNPDKNVCHVSLGNVRHASSGEGVPTMPPFLTCRFCLSRMSGLKIIVFETEVTFLLSLGHVVSGGEEREEHL